MFAIITTDSNLPIEDVYVTNTKEEAVEITRNIILITFKDDMDYWKTVEGPAGQSRIRTTQQDYEAMKTATWDDMQHMMCDGILEWIYIEEVKTPPKRPDVGMMQE